MFIDRLMQAQQIVCRTLVPDKAIKKMIWILAQLQMHEKVINNTNWESALICICRVIFLKWGVAVRTWRLTDECVMPTLHAPSVPYKSRSHVLMQAIARVSRMHAGMFRLNAC